MAKIITIPSSFDEIKKTKSIVDGYIIGIKNMSINMNLSLGVDDLDSIDDLMSDKEIFICMNKNMHNSDLPLIKDILLKLNKYNIKGLLYYDVAVLNIYNSLDLNYDLVWAAEHYTTNYSTINYWSSHNIKYTYLSSDITSAEINEISKKCKVKLMVNMFGYLPMFVSKRHIVENYLNFFDLEDDSGVNYIEKEDKIYPIIDSKIGTSVFSCNILNGIKTYLELDVDYIVLNSFDIKPSDFIKILEMFKNVNNDNVIEFNDKINNMFENVDSGFLNMKTIYRVKKNEK